MMWTVQVAWKGLKNGYFLQSKKYPALFLSLTMNKVGTSFFFSSRNRAKNPIYRQNLFDLQ